MIVIIPPGYVIVSLKIDRIDACEYLERTYRFFAFKDVLRLNDNNTYQGVIVFAGCGKLLLGIRTSRLRNERATFSDI